MYHANENVNLMEQNVIQINGEITINVEWIKTIHACEKDYVWDPATCICENRKHLPSIMDNSVITCDKVMKSHEEERKTIPKNFDEKNVTCKTQIFCILLTFLLITIALLMDLVFTVF